MDVIAQLLLQEIDSFRIWIEDMWNVRSTVKVKRRENQMCAIDEQPNKHKPIALAFPEQISNQRSTEVLGK